MAKIYKIGFTRPAMIRELVLVAQVHVDSKNWEETEEKISAMNLLQSRTKRSEKILFDELKGRLMRLNQDQMELIAEDHRSDVNQLSWIAVCKQYPFVADFVQEVVQPAVMSGRNMIDYDDYGYFFNSKADLHPELDAVSDKTRSNARGALFQMLRQCELLSDSNHFITQIISTALQNCTPQSELDLIPGAIRL